MLATTVTIPSWLIPGLILLVIGGVLTAVVRGVYRSFREWVREKMKPEPINLANENSIIYAFANVLDAAGIPHAGA